MSAAAGPAPPQCPRRELRAHARGKHHHRLSEREIGRILAALAAKGLISEAHGIPWDADPQIPRTIVLHDQLEGETA